MQIVTIWTEKKLLDVTEEEHKIERKDTAIQRNGGLAS